MGETAETGEGQTEISAADIHVGRRASRDLSSSPLALILVGALGQDIAGKASNNRERGTVECG